MYMCDIRYHTYIFKSVLTVIALRPSVGCHWAVTGVVLPLLDTNAHVGTGVLLTRGARTCGSAAIPTNIHPNKHTRKNVIPSIPWSLSHHQQMTKVKPELLSVPGSILYLRMETFVMNIFFSLLVIFHWYSLHKNTYWMSAHPKKEFLSDSFYMIQKGKRKISFSVVGFHHI